MHKIMNFQNNFGFSLYAVPSMYHFVTTSENEIEFKREMLQLKLKYKSIRKILY